MDIAALHKVFLEFNSVCTDTRKVKKNDLFFALKGANFNGNKFAKQAIEKGAKYAVVDEEFYNNDTQTILVKNVLETLQKLATYHRLYLNKPIIALTGSNGKTTTKELINAVLSTKYKTTATFGNLNNHIGVPLTLLSMTDDTEIGIIEMGANHQKEIDFLCHIAQPDYGYITNFGKAHLEGFGGVEGVVKGKSEMYDYLISHNKHTFVNTEDCIQVEKTKTAKIFTFGPNNNCNVIINFIEANPFVKLNYESKYINSQLIGDYNYSNIAVAITIGNYFKIDKNLIIKAIEDYVPNNNRSQIIEKGSTKIILDAYNANPTSMEAALLNLEKQKGLKIAILGDMFELGEDAEKEHQAITEQVIRLNINQVILIGENFYKVNLTSSKLKIFDSYECSEAAIKNSDFSNATLLIKGSRGMALERLLEIL